MLQPIVTNLAPAGKPPKQATRLMGTLAATILMILVVLDTLSPPGEQPNIAIGTIIYGVKTALGVTMAGMGLWALATTRCPLVIRIALALYALVVLVWFVIWLAGNPGGSVVTYLLNPTYSVWSWLLILSVPVIARMNRTGAITNAIARIPLTLGILLVLLPTLGIALFGMPLNSSNAGVAMLLILACRPTGGVLKRSTRIALTLVVGAAMLVGGYRIYALGAIAFALNQLLPRMTRRTLVAEIAFLTLAPLAFHYVIINYGETLASSGNEYFVDTRSFLMKELTDDFSETELFTGRGLDARYYSPYFKNISKYFSSDVGYRNIWRTTSEIGWLNVIMHLGIIGLIPFFIALVSPMFMQARSILIPADGLRRFLPTMMLLFAGEMWNAISAAYLCWYIALGALLSAALSPTVSIMRSTEQPPRLTTPR